MVKKIAILIFLLITVFNKSIAQLPIEVEGYFNIKQSKLLSDHWPSEYGRYNSFGLRSSIKFSDNLYGIIGIGINNNGFSNQIEIVTVEEPEGTGIFQTIDYNLRSLTVPVKIGYIIKRFKNITIGTELGISNDFKLEEWIIYRDTKDEVFFFNEHMSYLDLGINIAYDIGNNLNLTFRPTASYQLNKTEISPNFAQIYDDLRLFNFGADIGLSYNFNNSENK